MSKYVSDAQKRALDVVIDIIDRLTSNGNDNRPKFGRNIMDLILGILDVDYTYDNQITDLEGDKVLPIDPNNGNDRIHINIPDCIKELPTPPFSPHTPFPPQVWYNQEPEPIQTNKQEDRKYVTEITYTGDKNGIVYVSNTADVQYNGDFRDIQTSFNDK